MNRALTTKGGMQRNLAGVLFGVLINGLSIWSSAIFGENLNATPVNQSPNFTHASISIASHAGAALNSDLAEGGGSDDTAILQRLLDNAKDGKRVHLIIDGPALISGLSVHGNTTIECTAGGGLYLKDNSPGALIRNANRSRTAVMDEHIQIRNCFFNGNRSGQPTSGPEQSPLRHVQEPDGTLRSGLQFFGVNYLTLSDVILWNTRSFAVWIANAKVIDVRNVVVDSRIPPIPSGASIEEHRSWRGKHATNDDGLHFNGPIQYLTIDGAKLNTWDDGIALNANDWGSVDDITVDNRMGPFVGQGPITDVTISNVILMNSHHGIRLLSSDQRIDRILIQNVTGSIRERMAVLSHFTSPSRGNFGSVVFSNVNVQCLPHPDWTTLYPDKPAQGFRHQSYDIAEEGELPLFSLNGSIESLTLDNVTLKAIDNRPLIRIGRDASIQLLDLDLIIQDPDHLAVPIRLLGKVDRLRASLEWQGATPIQYRGGTVQRLRWQQLRDNSDE